MQTIDNMRSVIYDHAYHMFRDRNLPPNCTDRKAMVDAANILNEYTYGGDLTDMFTRIIRGAV